MIAINVGGAWGTQCVTCRGQGATEARERSPGGANHCIGEGETEGEPLHSSALEDAPHIADTIASTPSRHLKHVRDRQPPSRQTRRSGEGETHRSAEEVGAAAAAAHKQEAKGGRTPAAKGGGWGDHHTGVAPAGGARGQHVTQRARGAKAKGSEGSNNRTRVVPAGVTRGGWPTHRSRGGAAAAQNPEEGGGRGPSRRRPRRVGDTPRLRRRCQKRGEGNHGTCVAQALRVGVTVRPSHGSQKREEMQP